MLKRTMRAARLLPGATRLTIGDVAVPVVRPGWVLLEVRAAGLCHTDIHVMHGVEFSTKRGADYAIKRPLILGHEVAGIVVEVGSGDDAALLGTRMAAGGWAGPSTTPGMHFDGGFASYCLIPRGKLVPIPDAVDFDAAAVATDSIKTAYTAVRRTAGVRSGENVGIIGLGGLGMSALRTAVLLGARAYGVDISAARRDAARAAGATDCFESVDELTDAGGVGVDAIVDFVGGETTAAAVEAVNENGRVVLVGLGDTSLTIDPRALVLGRKSLIGSLGSQNTADFVAVLDELGRANLTPEIEVIPFDDLNAGYDRLSRGEVSGRLVVHPPQPA
ncbi:zinc-binding dehydrogenase [Subtercola endophyticus]|uniref:zinc-binding dehydrogenase n=1 Tax=Subtercola endophyticus TaxID=2895559 RepID=UPI001E526F5B|nr:zinc-binding dehydrogenase [Subtercola endophyticus]UFS58313.1 zinc-binding dehydrogenase [Subtercola endophyticus]